MTPSHTGLVIGVDAGGTKTTAWIAGTVDSRDSPPRGAGHSGPGNPQATEFDVATAAITAAIGRAFADADLPKKTVDSLCLSVAGAGRPGDQERLRLWAESQRIAHTVTVTGDAEPILAAASPDGTGMALISGTGSLAWGRNSDGRVERVGGWGYLLGDEGSGHAIAVSGLRAAVRAADGRRGSGVMLPEFMKRLGAAAPPDLVQVVYGERMSREQIAACADIVFETAAHDPVAAEIVANAARELADMVVTLASKLEFSTADAVLGMAGGTLMNQSAFRTDVIARIGLSPEQVVPVPVPVAGAVAIARMAITNKSGHAPSNHL